ncbi:MAG: arsenate reductase ArsC, partial [Actinobacteria bacterium]|nr:arsenate reductase ArsC [Actinomycetota bacterium]
ENEIIEHAVQQLSRKYAGKFDESDIVPIVKESYQSFADTKVRTFVAVFTARYADDRLRAMAKNRGLINDAPPSVLFVCVHNAGRSQMAAGWLRHLSRGKIEVYSGGSLPGKDLNASAVEAMREVGIDIANEFPKPFAVDIFSLFDCFYLTSGLMRSTSS